MRRWTALVLVLVLGGGALAADVTVDYLGHSCFTIQEAGGPIVMIDPYSSYVPYPALPKAADIVLITHGHVDHDPASFGEFNRVLGDPVYVRKLGSNGRCQEKVPPETWTITDAFETSVVEGNHVNVRGGGQGFVCIYIFEVGGIRFAHVGDLGRTLSDKQVTALSDVDVLFLPVGNQFTLSTSEAMTVIGQLPSLKIAIPMHYRITGITPWPGIQPLSSFTSVAGQTYTVHTIGGSKIVLTPETLPSSTEVWVLDYER